MIRMKVLLPIDDTIKHVKAICETSKMFGTSYLTPKESELDAIPIAKFRVWEKSGLDTGKTRPSEKPEIGSICVLPARDDSILLLIAGDDSVHAAFDQFVGMMKDHFRSSGLLFDTLAEPWRASSPDKMERDRIIWERRNLGDTWEQVAEKAQCGISTAKDRYRDMLGAVTTNSG